MRFSCDPETNRASIFIFLNYIFIWKSLVISFFSCCRRLLRFTSFCTDLQTIFSSTSELLSTWFLKFVAMRFFFLSSFFLFFGFSSGCNFQHFFSVWPSMLQWLQWLLGSLHYCVVAAVFLSFPPFFFFFHSLEVSCSFFCFDPLNYALFRPIFSKYCAYT